MNLGFVALQPVSAGFFLSGYGRAVAIHRAIAVALQLGALVQAVTAVVLFRRGSVPAVIVGMSLTLFLMVLLQNWLGYSKLFWLHIPIGVGLFGGLIRQTARLETLSHGSN